ncbi:hypothetical protein EJB05_03857 [Eragrostis curvula]|uniref:Trichome birefringence-like C-terminal domain-containing protein n=1 Tax=Eragrostis curvula TaxID=38414 RepID=A0A5J9W8U7_9POAL|nr:hypothetical protein EJB05_03857 [Eragrostis curvula]
MKLLAVLALVAAAARSSASPASFNATMMLEMLRGKRMLFVGDSLNRGQYISLICLLHRAIPDGSKSFESIDSLSIFRAKVQTSCWNYDATIEFYWAPMLAESNSDDAVVHRVDERVIRGAPMDKHSRFLEGRQHPGVQLLPLVDDRGEDPDPVITAPLSRGADYDMSKDNRGDAGRGGVQAGAVSGGPVAGAQRGPQELRVFFVNRVANAHRLNSDMQHLQLGNSSRDWGDETEGGNCYNRTSPIGDASYWGSTSKAMLRVTGEVLAESRVPVGVVNVTQLSEYRADAHTQTYKKLWAEPTPEQRADPRSYADCTHWCLPGVPDT